ncbi:hypothetical protein MLD38_022635 [Melastoma candidum]|nr:hypothetical protein MLD38_022635 [Melastoma candidum]
MAVDGGKKIREEEPINETCKRKEEIKRAEDINSRYRHSGIYIRLTRTRSTSRILRSSTQQGLEGTPITFVPFGGGLRMRSGKEYGRIQIIAFIRNVATDFRFEEVYPNEKISYKPYLVLANGLLLRLMPH